MSTTSYNQAIEDAAKVAEAEAPHSDGEIWIARRISEGIRALRQPASDTPDPRDEVIAEMREALRFYADVKNHGHYRAVEGDNGCRARAALSKGEGAK